MIVLVFLIKYSIAKTPTSNFHTVHPHITMHFQTTHLHIVVCHILHIELCVA